MTYTPGPWKILRHDLGDEEIFFVPVEILAGNGKLVVAYEGGLAPAAQEWTVEEIEANASLIAAAPDMLRALEEVMGELDVEGLPCPLCGRDLTIGHRRNCIWHVVASAVRKARGEE